MKKKFLLAEDNADRRCLATFFLQGERFAIMLGETGAAALRMLPRKQFAPVLLGSLADQVADMMAAA